MVKEARRITDPRKKDLSPDVLDFGPVRFKIARHFGFCYGVENAVEIATGEEQSHLQELLEALKAGHAHDVEHELEEMLGQEPHGS